MNNEITPFNHAPFGSLRVVMDEETGKPWFVAKDVADKLGYTNPQKAVRDHCKYSKLFRVNESFRLKSGNNNYGVNIIPEPDLYRLIIKSKLPAAEQFEAWVMAPTEGIRPIDSLPLLSFRQGSESVSPPSSGLFPLGVTSVVIPFHWSVSTKDTHQTSTLFDRRVFRLSSETLSCNALLLNLWCCCIRAFPQRPSPRTTALLFLCAPRVCRKRTPLFVIIQ